DVDAQIAQFENQTGLALPADLQTIFGDNILFAVDQEGLTAAAIQAEDPTLFNAGVRFTSDPAALNAIYGKLLPLIQQEMEAGVLPFVKRDLDDGIAIATNEAYADKLGSDGGLGETDAFQSVIDDAAAQEFVAYFNWDSVEDPILQALQGQGEGQEVVDNLRPLEAFGATFDIEDNYMQISFQVSVND
ncbi:MAG: hypothetical protein H0U28_07880, partial [Nocardioidaceae bacterium]|nr:hypothetical protein [Nocardioidaceae bacterium]